MLRKPLQPDQFHLLAEYGLDTISTGSCACLEFDAGETVLQEGQPIPGLLLVAVGTAKVCRTSPNGRNLIFCYYVSGGILGDVEFMTGSRAATCSVIAMSNLSCIAVPLSDPLALHSNTFFLNRLAGALADKLVRCSQGHASAALYSGEARLCAYILQASRGGVFRDSLTDTACLVGMSYRHMFRLLHRLCLDGLLCKESCGYRVADPAGLASRAADLLEK